MLWLLCILLAGLQGCNRPSEALSLPKSIPLLEQVHAVRVFDRDGALVIEHTDDAHIAGLLRGMQEASPAYIEEPEPFGERYQLVILSGQADSLTYTINDLSATAANDISVKLYTTQPDQEETTVWELPLAWLQSLLEPELAEEEPTLRAVTDENAEAVIVMANRALQRASLTEAVRSGLQYSSAEEAAQPRYTIHWSDDRRVVIRLRELSPGQSARLVLDGVLSVEGDPLILTKPSGASSSCTEALHEGRRLQ